MTGEMTGEMTDCLAIDSVSQVCPGNGPYQSTHHYNNFGVLGKVAFPLACRLRARSSEGPLRLSVAALLGFTAACRLGLRLAGVDALELAACWLRRAYGFQHLSLPPRCSVAAGASDSRPCVHFVVREVTM